MLKWLRIYRFARALTKNLDSRKEIEAVAYYVAANLNDEGKLGVSEWAKVGSLLGILGKK